MFLPSACTRWIMSTVMLLVSDHLIIYQLNALLLNWFIAYTCSCITREEMIHTYHPMIPSLLRLTDCPSWLQFASLYQICVFMLCYQIGSPYMIMITISIFALIKCSNPILSCKQNWYCLIYVFFHLLAYLWDIFCSLFCLIITSIYR